MGIKDSVNEKIESIRADKERKIHEKFMRLALKEAEKAYSLKEVPIGCVIVKDGYVIARGYNRRNTDRNVLNHAEMDAIRTACKKIKDWRLEDCEIYITLEPCPMCAGAIVQARIPHVIIGAMNPKAGCAGSVVNLLDMPGFNHQCEVVRGVLEDECSEMLSEFFRELRAEAKMPEEESEPAPEENEENPAE